MSGIAGFSRLDGAPAEAGFLDRLASALPFSTPAEIGKKLLPTAGLCHAPYPAALVTGQPTQPLNLDGRYWITADARIDDQKTLRAKLALDGARHSDAELILLAYRKWGLGCPEHLLGDFAFAIWDEQERTLFCARDRFGVKPFFYAADSRMFAFSNVFPSVRKHPAVTGRLHDLAIADFLVWGHNLDPATTSFAGLARLPPSHSLTISDGRKTLGRYWKPQAAAPLRYKRNGDYVEQFWALIEAAVADRLRHPKATIWLSGGLDSPAVAEAANRAARTETSLQAFTLVYERLFDDPERRYAPVAARALRLPQQMQIADDYLPFQGPSAPTTSAPNQNLYFALNQDALRRNAAHSALALSGQGGDEIFVRELVLDVFPRFSLFELARDLTSTVVLRRLRPGIGLRAALNKVRCPAAKSNAAPSWLCPELNRRLDLEARYSFASEDDSLATRSARPTAIRRLLSSIWPACLEFQDPAVTGVPVETVYPMLDLRLVHFALALPPFPWCVNKYLLRQATVGVLPPAIRNRKKTPLAGDPLRSHRQVLIDRLAETACDAWSSYIRIEPLRERLVDARDIDSELWQAGWCLEFARWFAACERGNEQGVSGGTVGMQP